MLNQLRVVNSAIALVLALLLSGVLLAIVGEDPISAFLALIDGAFGDGNRIGETLTNSTPLILTGLAVALAFRGGLFNIGAEGQLLMGAVTAAAVGPQLGGVQPLNVLILLVLGAASGAAWAFVPGLLKARAGANEVITTLMMSYIAFYLSSYLIVNVFKAPGVLPATEIIAETARLPRLQGALASVASLAGVGSLAPEQFLGRLHLGFPIALVIAVLLAYLVSRTVPGFTLRVEGLNPDAASYAGARAGGTVIATMMASGAVAGLAGAVQVLAVTYRMSSEFSPGFGFTGIAVALVGALSAAGIVLAATLFAMLQTGGQVMQREAGTPVAIIDVIQGLVIFLVAVQVALPRAIAGKAWAGIRGWAHRWRS